MEDLQGGNRGHDSEYFSTDMILLFGRAYLSRSAVGEEALLPYKIYLSYRIFGPLRESEWDKRAETWGDILKKKIRIR
jgi:hypothetical protein